MDASHPQAETAPSRYAGLRAGKLLAGAVLAVMLLVGLASHASAQIVLDGNIAEADWHQLGTSAGGPAPGFGSGHEINALYANLDSTYFYLAVAGNVQPGNRILVFIDSQPGGYTDGNFGRNGAPPGIGNFNTATLFDDHFTPNYVLVIGSTGSNNTWELFRLSGEFGAGGGPNLYLGDRNDPDLGAIPANSSQTLGFEARLTYSPTGAGVDLAIDQSAIRLMAAYIRDDGFLSNQFITRADPGDFNYGSGQILFNTAAPNPVLFPHTLVVNEIDYIQPGVDNAEFIEIKNISNFSVNLTNFRLRFARRANTPPDVYRQIDLPAINLAPGAYFVVCTNPALVPSCTFVVEPPTDLLENATPAAVAIFFENTLVDTVSYGGNTGAPYTEGSGVVPTEDGTVPRLGISRVIDGLDTNRNNVDFGLHCITPGQPNSSQSTNCVSGVGTATFTPTGTPTVTGTPTPTPTGTPTPFRGTHVPPPPTDNCRNILTNGDFESNAAWEFGRSPVPGKYVSQPAPHSGLRAVLLGNPPDSGHPPMTSYSSIRQRVMVPHGAAAVKLRWFHIYRTESGPTPYATDQQPRQEVILLKPNGDTLRVLDRVRQNERGWQENVLDLTPFAGETFYVYFNAYNTGDGGRTWMYLDDVELLVCGPGGPGYPSPYYPTAYPPNYPTAYPTAYYPPYHPTAYPPSYPTAYPTAYYPPYYPTAYPPNYPTAYPTAYYPPYYPTAYPPNYPTPTRPYYYATPTPTWTPTPIGGVYCDPSYPTVCIAPPPPYLDCRDIPYTAFPVIGADPHDLDGNNNGIGCEDY